MISEKYNCIFVHINKVAGSSFRRFLEEPDWVYNPHISVNQYIEQIGKDQFEKYFSFAFVRNPWDRAVSAFNFRKQNGKHKIPEDYPFLKFLKKTPILFSGNQLDYISEEPWIWDKELRKYTYKPETKIAVDFVGRFENLRQDVEYIKEQLGIKKEFPHENKTNHKHYREYYTDETKDIVSLRCQRDIEFFGYEF